jgi:hypothetical protein
MSKQDRNKNIFLSILGIILLLYVSYRVVIEIRDNYENQREDQYTRELVQQLRTIDPRVNDIVDQLRFFEGDKSYTLDKKYVFLCKKDKKTHQQYHRNQLTLVLLHEISHALCDEVGHTPKFDMILEELLIKAQNAGLYDDRIPHVDGYCE